MHITTRHRGCVIVAPSGCSAASRRLATAHRGGYLLVAKASRSSIAARTLGAHARGSAASEAAAEPRLAYHEPFARPAALTSRDGQQSKKPPSPGFHIKFGNQHFPNRVVGAWRWPFLSPRRPWRRPRRPQPAALAAAGLLPASPSCTRRARAAHTTHKPGHAMPTRGDAPSAPVRPAPSARRRGRHAPAAPPKRWPPPPPIRRQRRHTGRRRKNRRSAAPTASEAAERGTRSRIEQSRHGAASPLPLPEPRADTRVGCATMPAGPVHSRKASGGRERRPGSREAENEADSGLHSGKAGEWARRASGAHREARGRGGLGLEPALCGRAKPRTVWSRAGRFPASALWRAGWRRARQQHQESRKRVCEFRKGRSFE